MTSFGLCLVAAVPALASGEPSHEGGWGPWFTLFCSFVNFGIFLLLMRRFARAPLRDYLRARRKRVIEEMEAAARARREAEALRQEYERKLAGLEQAKAELEKEIAAIAESERERVLQAARAAGERMVEDAERRARFELENAKRKLRAEAARLAAELASAELVRRLGAEDQRRLIADFLERLEAL